MHIPCVLMRGGSSKGLFFFAKDLPSDPQARDRMLLAAMGSPDARQIDGMGGGNDHSSKVVIVGPSSQRDADVEYLFAQVSVGRGLVDVLPNSGNMLAGVAPFAIEYGLVKASSPVTKVRILNTNSQKVVEATVQTPGGKVSYSGHFVLDGVPGGEQQNSLYPRVPAPNPNRTGAWFFPSESGWGTAYDDHVSGGAFDQVGINYLYGGDGTARWSLGATSSPNSGTIAQNTYLVHCPTCPNFADLLSFPLSAGSVSRTFDTQTSGTQTMNVVFPAPLGGSFTRNAVPFQMLTTPQPQGN